jgi:hypothetical protein
VSDDPDDLDALGEAFLLDSGPTPASKPVVRTKVRAKRVSVEALRSSEATVWLEQTKDAGEVQNLPLPAEAHDPAIEAAKARAEALASEGEAWVEKVNRFYQDIRRDSTLPEFLRAWVGSATFSADRAAHHLRIAVVGRVVEKGGEDAKRDR